MMMVTVSPGYTFDLVIQKAMQMQNNAFIDAVFILVMFDLITGSLKAWKPNAKRHLNSTKGLSGLVKHSLILSMIAFLFPLVAAMGFETEANAILTWFVIQYSISIMENLEVLGVPFPSFLRNKFEKMAEQDEKLIKKDEGKDETK